MERSQKYLATILNKQKTVMISPAEVRPALCLDLDGTVRYSKNGDFINKPEDIVLFNGVEEKIWEYRNNDFLILGVTNQAGVAFGHKTPMDFNEELACMSKLWKKDPFHTIQGCFHHENGTVKPFNHRSLFRKPGYGMLAFLESECFEDGNYIIDWDKSIFVGDRPEDKACADNAKIEFIPAWKFFGRDKLESDLDCENK